MENKRRQINSMDPEQRDSRNARRRARRENDSVTPLNIQLSFWDCFTTE